MIMHAGDHELPLGRQGEHAEAVGQERQDQDAERHAEQAADPAGQADPAEHDCRDDLELEAETGDMNRRAEARGKHDAGDGREQRADDEAGEFHALDVVAGETRDFGIAADGIDLAAERAVAHQIGEETSKVRAISAG